MLEREREAAQRLRELDALKNDFVAMVAHDLRTPMTVITGFATMLLEGGDRLDPLQRQRALETIYRSVENLAALVDDVLQVARIESGSLNFEIGEFDIVDLVRRAAKEVTPPETPDRVRLTADDDLPLARGDDGRTWQAVSNLLSN